MAQYILVDLPRLFHIRSLISSIDIIHSADFEFAGESHDFWEIVYVKDGVVGITADERVYTLSTGDLIFHKPMEFHRIWSKEGKEHSVIILSFDAEGSGMSVFENRLLHLTAEEEQHLQSIATLATPFIDAYCESGRAAIPDFSVNAQTLAANMELFLLQLMKNVSEVPLPSYSQSSNYYRDIVRILNENYNRDLQIQDIAELCGLSVSNLKKIFHQFSDKGIMKTFIHIKLRRAIAMLDQGLSISEISELLSFSSSSYFTYVFRRETGYSPTFYRKNRHNIVLLT